ncbi:hypothetical protein D3C72_2315700 [compost metagenome]
MTARLNVSLSISASMRRIAGMISRRSMRDTRRQTDIPTPRIVSTESTKGQNTTLSNEYRSRT